MPISKTADVVECGIDETLSYMCLKESKYSHATGPTRFYRSVPGVDDPIKVDLISGEYVNDEKVSTTQVDELRLNGWRGIDLAFEDCEEITIEGTMPDETHNIVSLICSGQWLLDIEYPIDLLLRKAVEQ